jgi:hypothetical protein
VNLRLFHVSDIPGITRFEPRPAPDPRSGPGGNMVWAIDEARLHNYLFPRDCPRVTFYASAGTSAEDQRAFFAGSTARAVAAIEWAWFTRLVNGRLFLYELRSDSFVVQDAVAGYYISTEPVEPVSVRPVTDLPGELLRRQVELRVMPSLWELSDAVAASTLAFSIIRIRNAQPRPAGASAV